MKTQLLSAMFALATISLQAQTIYVTPTGTGNGTSWANAANLEAAVANASSGAEIWVQRGTYYPSKMLNVPTLVKLYGGFAGTETALSQRDLAEGLSVVDAQNKFGSIVRLDEGAVLNGFVIQHGNAQGSPNLSGGGVHAKENSVIESCRIINNVATANGGGVFANGQVTIINSVVQGNSAGINGSNMYGYCIVLAAGSCLPGDVVTEPEPPVGTPPSVVSQNMPAQTQEQGVAFAAISVTATGMGPLSYQWYSNSANSNSGGTAIETGGTDATFIPPSDVVGTMYYYVVVTNALGSVTSGVSGLHTVTTPPPPPPPGCNSNTPGWGSSLGTVSFASATTWTVAGQTWSDAVTATACDKAPYAGGSSGNYNADCRSNPSYKGDLFSWCAVMRFADQLCTGDWRVPTTTEFATLTNATNGANTVALLTAASGARSWGGAYGGNCDGSGGLYNQGTHAYYWSSTEHGATTGYNLYFRSNGNVSPQYYNYKNLGFTLRCVR